MNPEYGDPYDMSEERDNDYWEQLANEHAEEESHEDYGDEECEECGADLTLDEIQEGDLLCDLCAGRDRCNCSDPHCPCSGQKNMLLWG